MNDYEIQAAQLEQQRKQMLAQQLQAQDAPDGRMVGNRYVKSNPLEFLAQGLRQYMGNQQLEKNNQAQSDLSTRKNTALTDALRQYSNLAQGTPATAETPDDIVPGVPAQAAQAPNMQAANLSLMGSGFEDLRKFGMQGQFEGIKENERIAGEQRKLAQSQALQKQMMGVLAQSKSPQEALQAGVPFDMVKHYFEAPLLGKEKLHNVNGQMIGEQTGMPVGAQIPVQRSLDAEASLAQSDRHFNMTREDGLNTPRGVQVQTDNGPVFADPRTGRSIPITGANGQPLPAVAKPSADYLKQAEAYQNMDDALTNYRKSLVGFGKLDMLNPSKRAEMGQAYQNTLLQAKEIYKLGVLNGGDERILKGIINSPLDMSSVLMPTDSMIKQADDLQAIIKRNNENLAKVNKQPTMALNSQANKPASSQDSAAMAWAKANPRDPRAAKILQHLGQ
jgi:hypothetical protein